MTATVVRPPSTSITLPWTKLASSLARYTAAWAMDSGVPLLPAGVPRIMISAGCSSNPSGPWLPMTTQEARMRYVKLGTGRHQAERTLDIVIRGLRAQR
jgi:hypothetical protein